MNPELKSVLGTVFGYVGVAAATWGVARGLVPEADKSAIANMIATAVPALIAAAVAEYKRRTAKPAALVAAVEKISPATVAAVVAKTSPETLIAAVNNAPNGLKVVASAGPGTVERAPLK